MKKEDKQFLTLAEVADYLGVSKNYLYRLTYNKEIPHYKPTGKLIYFMMSELLEWIESGRVSSNRDIDEQAGDTLTRM